MNLVGAESSASAGFVYIKGSFCRLGLELLCSRPGGGMCSADGSQEYIQRQTIVACWIAVVAIIRCNKAEGKTEWEKARKEPDVVF